MKVSGIYRIVCVKNGRYYYGSAINIANRWYKHQRSLQEGDHHNPHMQRVWNKHGKDTFRMELVEEVDPDSDLLRLVEQDYLNEYVGKSNCMNIAKFADAPTRNREIGPHSNKTRRNISESIKQCHVEGRCKGTFPRENKIWCGRKHSLETRKKMSMAAKGRVPWNKGLSHSEETKRKISKSVHLFHHNNEVS